MTSRRFQLIDVFSEQPFFGNPLAVVLDGDGLSTEAMQQFTRWMNLSESTFLLPPTVPEADYRVRIFTLDRELPFAGHPTLGSCHAWLRGGGRPRREAEIVQECAAGLVAIRRVVDGLAFAAPPLIRTEPVDEATLDDITKVLTISRGRILDAQWIDNGPGWVAVLLETAQAVLDVEPAGAHPTRVDIGVVGLYPNGQQPAIEVRAIFSDPYGSVREDPVTGSLNASVAQWLLGSGRIRAPYIASQGGRVGRRGRVHITQGPDGVIWVGGRATTIVEGHIPATFREHPDQT